METTIETYQTSVTIRLLLQRRDQLLEELRALAPEVVENLELTLEALSLREHGSGFDR